MCWFSEQVLLLKPWLACCILIAAACSLAVGQTAWYERFSLRGYTQLRYVQTHSLSVPSVWSSGGFTIRRGRLILSGFARDNVFLYIQPDVAASSGTSLNVLQLRDAYFDVFFDSLHTWRVRVGQSKVPFGYENMQSSSLRLPIERAEVFNTASVPGERDLGVFLMWASPAARQLYARLTRNGQKGSGDYGCISLGIYNGQGINRPKINRTPYVQARATYPVEIGNAIIEPAIQAFAGRFTPQVSAGVQSDISIRDERYAVSIAVSSSPIGLLAEYGWGHAPRYVPPSNGGSGYIQSGRIEGGFVTVYATTTVGEYPVLPFARYQILHGGIKSLSDAPMTDLVQGEVGIEWHWNPALELTLEYMMSERRALSTIGQTHQRNEAVWLQLQVNY